MSIDLFAKVRSGLKSQLSLYNNKLFRRRSLQTGLIAAFVAGLIAIAGSYVGLFKSVTHANPVLAAKRENANVNTSAADRLSEIPEHVKFTLLFHHLANIQRRGRLGLLEGFRQRTGLSSVQFGYLIQLALDEERDASAIDTQARAIVDNYHAMYPPGTVPRGTVLPPAPEELGTLQESRNAVSLNYRDRLRTMIGEDANTRFRQFLDSEFSANIVERGAPEAARTTILGGK